MGAARTAVKAVARAVDLVRHPHDGVVVLIYHRVGGRTPCSVDLPTPLFRRQLEHLAMHDRVISLDDAIAELTGERASAGPAVVITFDDGTSDFCDESVPLLAEFRVPATLYVATRHVDEQIDLAAGGRPASWAGLADALASGVVTLGSHTHSHALLDRVDAPAAAAELDRSIELLEDRLGVTPAHFAYPKAASGASADREVRRRFRSAAVAGCRANRPGRTDPYALRRSPIQVQDGMRWFRAKAGGGLGLEDDLRRLANRRRYADAIT